MSSQIPFPPASSFHTQPGFPATKLHVPASRLHLSHSDLSCPCFLFASPLCFCLNPPPFSSHSVQKQLLPCSAPGNSPNLQCSHGNTLPTHPLLSVWDRQPGPECQNPPVKDSQTPARGVWKQFPGGSCAVRRLLCFHSLVVSCSNRCTLSTSSWRVTGAKQAPVALGIQELWLGQCYSRLLRAVAV